MMREDFGYIGQLSQFQSALDTTGCQHIHKCGLKCTSIEIRLKTVAQSEEGEGIMDIYMFQIRSFSNKFQMDINVYQ